MFRTKVVEKIKTHILNSVTFFFRKSCRLWDNVEKCVKAGQAAVDNKRRIMRFERWITKATDTYWECVILIAFHINNGYANSYVARKLPVLFCHMTVKWGGGTWYLGVMAQVCHSYCSIRSLRKSYELPIFALCIRNFFGWNSENIYVLVDPLNKY